MIGFHNLNLLAAGVAFFTFLALTPLLTATVMTYGVFGSVETVQQQMQSVSQFLPAEATQLLEEQLLAIVTTSKGVAGFALAISLFFSIYGGMRAANGMLAALNVINEEHETRNIVRTTLQALGLTLAAIGIALTGVLSIGLSPYLLIVGVGAWVLFRAVRRHERRTGVWVNDDELLVGNGDEFVEQLPLSGLTSP